MGQHALRRRPIRDLRPEVPVNLVPIANRMMAVDPSKRFPNPAAVANALVMWQQGLAPDPEAEPAMSTPQRPAGSPRPARPAEAKKGNLRWAVVGALLLVLGIGVVVWWMRFRT